MYRSTLQTLVSILLVGWLAAVAPAGTLEAGESPLDCARRELTEETGLTGGSWRERAVFYTTPGFCRELMHLFFAEDLEPGPAHPEDDEQLELVRWRKGDIESRLREIEDAKTLVGLLTFLHDAGGAASD